MNLYYEITGQYELINNSLSVMRTKLLEVISDNNLDVEDYFPNGSPVFFTSHYNGIICIKNTKDLVLLWYMDKFKFSEIEICYAWDHAQDLIKFNSWDTVVGIAAKEGFEDLQDALDLAIKLDLMFSFKHFDDESESAIF